MLIYTLESKVQLWPILCRVIRGLFAQCLRFLLLVATIRMYYCSLEHSRNQGGAKRVMAPQMKQTWASAEIFPGGANSTFCLGLSFSSC